jgi:hypothetical protein
VSTNESVGYLASLLVLATFCMQGMVALRAVAILSNVAFITYAALVGIGPVMLLHVLLLPMNLYRLSQALHERRLRQGGASVVGHARSAEPCRRPAAPPPVAVVRDTLAASVVAGRDPSRRHFSPSSTTHISRGEHHHDEPHVR